MNHDPPRPVLVFPPYFKKYFTNPQFFLKSTFSPLVSSAHFLGLLLPLVSQHSSTTVMRRFVNYKGLARQHRPAPALIAQTYSVNKVKHEYFRVVQE